jgi:hypothetical protein
MVAVLQSSLKISGDVARVFEQRGAVVSSCPNFLPGHVTLLKISSQRQGSPYVAILSPLVAAGQKEDDIVTFPLEVHAISRAVVDAKFTDSAANKLRVASQPDLAKTDVWRNSATHHLYLIRYN